MAFQSEAVTTQNRPFNDGLGRPLGGVEAGRLSVTCHRSSTKSSTIRRRTLQPCGPESTNKLSGKPGTVHRLPRQHHKHLKSTNLLERLNEEIKRRTRVVRLFPNPASCLRLVRALCAETHEGWLEDHRYLNMDFLKEQKKDLLQAAA